MGADTAPFGTVPGSSANLDLDPARLGVLGLGDAQLEHPVLERRVALRGIQLPAQGKGPPVARLRAGSAGDGQESTWSLKTITRPWASRARPPRGWQPGQDFHPPPGWDAGFKFRGNPAGEVFGGDFSDFFATL